MTGGTRGNIGTFARFAAVGVVSNVALYLGYLGLTLARFGPKFAMTVCFVGGVLLSFALNRSWSFKSKSPTHRSLPRYALTYAGGYVVNLAGLVAFVDWWGFPHQIVQACLIVVVAVLMFVAQRTWVFGPWAERSRADAPHATP